jgi:TonB family protein
MRTIGRQEYMPEWIRTTERTGLLCLALSIGFCQDNPGVPRHRAQRGNQSSLEHYQLGEQYLEQDNLQSAANEFREALSGDQDAPWTVVWSHIKLARIFDASGQHDRAVNEYRDAQQTGDNTNGALDEANNYLEHAGQAVYLAPHAVRDVIRVREPIQKTEPEYTDEARLAGLEGTVLLHGEIDDVGVARNLEVEQSIGLGLDEKAIEAVEQWHFPPNFKSGATFEIPVAFRLASKQSRWHLIGVEFGAPTGVSRPVFSSAAYPIGAGIGPEAMEEGRVLVAIGRLATAKLTFDVDEQGVPAHFQIPNASEPVWGSEATALVGQWRFTPAMKNGIAVPVPCTVELVWGEKELTSDLERQLHDVLAVR